MNNHTTSAARQRRHRQRQRDGLVVLPAVVIEVDITELLRAAGYLNGTAEPSREVLAAALSRWIYREVTRNDETRWQEL